MASTSLHETAAAEIYQYSFEQNSNTAAANVMRFVGTDKTVLEIGAGPGSISRPLVELSRNRLTAIELDAKCVEILSGFCENVIPADLNNAAWPELLNGKRFDAIVIADVLEHLYDPWTTLKLAVNLLTENGSVVVSLPHASHAAILASMMNNDFKYNDWGLLDRTHIRFFSMKNIQALFESAGLKIVEYAYVIKRPDETEFQQAWHSLSPRAQAILEDGDFSHVYQVVVRAVPVISTADAVSYNLPLCKASRVNKLKFIAFYLPQFHPIAENDLWWGKGFTEWTNTARAQQMFEGHYQPHLPADFGYYDLRIRDVQHEQIKYARQYGIDAFCFHYYWFGGRRLLERPVEDFLNDQDADIEFCLCWANENWTRGWDASEHEILIEQTYSPENDIAFIESVLPFFRDRRYLRAGGAPVLVVYRPQQIPDPKGTVRRWRQFCRANGIGEIHLVAALTHGNADFESFGFDAGVEFPPHNIFKNISIKNLRDHVVSKCELTGTIVSYSSFAEAYLGNNYQQRRVYRSVFPSWDNTARRLERATIVLDGTPENYESWLAEAALRTIAERAPEDRLLFINAWNEWAEGCHLEPDQKYGTQFLEATLRVKDGSSKISTAFSSAALPKPKLTGLQLRRKIKLWGADKLQAYPFAYKGVRSVYRRYLNLRR